ncbi:MAG: CoA transferase, partial [Gaiellales bacterium]
IDLQYDLSEQGQAKLRGELETTFSSRPADAWEQLLVGVDGGGSCVAVALHPSEVATHPQLAARGAVRELPAQAGAFMPASPYVVDGVRSDADH